MGHIVSEDGTLQGRYRHGIAHPTPELSGLWGGGILNYKKNKKINCCLFFKKNTVLYE